MKKTGCFSSTFSFLIGIFLVFEGIWGLISDSFLWLFSTNQLHASIHLFLGILGIRMCFWQKSVIYCYTLGFLVLMSGIARLIHVADPVTITLLNMNVPAAYLSIGTGICAILCGMLGND